jgi:hypothetical protein
MALESIFHAAVMIGGLDGEAARKGKTCTRAITGAAGRVHHSVASVTSKAS